MSVRVRPNGAGIDRPVLVLAVAAVVVTVLGALWLVRAAVGGRPDYRTVRVDNQAALPVQVDVAGPGGGRLGLGAAGPQATTTFAEVADPGGTWTFVVSYGGQELLRQPVSGQELAARGWTVQLPEAVTVELERQGYR
ncbi:MAG TPA: hypothetical protein VLA80_01595 [Actinomycetota bacterium]|nr:hypothetical protein [Actinomycetota bacterium]